MKKRVILLFTLFCLFNCVYAQDNETTVSTLELNQSQDIDLEVFMDSADRILIPVKQTAKILKIKYNENHSAKEISFLTHNNAEVLINKNGVFYNSEIITQVLQFKKDGILETDEYFIDEKTASKIFESDIQIDKTTLSVILSCNYISESNDKQTNQ